MYSMMKFVLTALLVVIISEVAKRSTLLGALIASLPLTSLLAILWLYIETKDAGRIAQLSSDIGWLVLPSLVFFILLPILLRAGINFPVSLISSIGAMLIAYGLTVFLRRLSA